MELGSLGEPSMRGVPVSSLWKENVYWLKLALSANFNQYTFCPHPKL